MKDNLGLEIKPTKIKNSLSNYDAIIIPGGLGTRQLQTNDDFINWIKTAVNIQYKISICTGDCAAGFLVDKKATTHFENYDSLKQYCKQVLTDRVVEDGNIITAGAVSSSIDLGLYLCKKWAGQNAANEIKTRMNYSG